MLAANEKYTGADAAELSQVVFQPFTDDTSQFNLLRSGGIDYGYIPPNALDQQEIIEQTGTPSSRGTAGPSPMWP